LNPLDLASFGGQNLGYGLPMRCTYYPQIIAQVRGVIRDIRVWIWTLVGFCSGERLGEFAVVSCGCCFEIGAVWSLGGQFGVLGLSGLDRSDRCV
jgi:hypothetical protein